jgi:hypothetical protein
MVMAQRRTVHIEEGKSRGPAYSAATVNNKFGKSISGYS